MSAPSAPGQRGGSAMRGGRPAPFSPAPRGRGSVRGPSRGTPPGRGRGRGGLGASPSASNAEGLLQQMRSGTIKRGSENGMATPTRGRGASSTTPMTPNSRGRGGFRGRGSLSQTFNTPRPQPSTPVSRPASPAPSNHRDFMNAAFAKFQVLKQKREEERAKAIRDGFLADPEKKTSLDKAITPVGTCTEMCPEFERVERIVQNMVDKVEKVDMTLLDIWKLLTAAQVHNADTGKDIPSEERMVKRFRRSAAGYDEQLPSDIRTPATLQKTLDYLLDKIIGGEERLATIHKFVWDRTRGIRNDFSIQQVTNANDVRIAVDCYERIARFHILSLHQLSNPDNLWDGENFDAHQEREQLNNTLLSLLYYYDDNRKRVDFPHEAEFRAYCIIFEFQSQHPDLEDRMQSWPSNLLADKRVQTALKLYSAAGSSLFDQGPLRPLEPFAIAQSNTGNFWSLLSSKAVPYIMACVAEIYFGQIRFAALDAVWRSCKSAPVAQQAKSRDWGLTEVTSFLGFDTEEETRDFCAAFDLYFGTDEHGEEYLDITANAAPTLDQSSIPSKQSFSYSHVEKKRYRRTLTAVINGTGAAEAIRKGWVEPEGEPGNSNEDVKDDEQSMFVPENRPSALSTSTSTFGSSLNPAASTFTPTFGSSPASINPPEISSFGQPTSFNGTGFGSTSFGSFGSPGVPTVPSSTTTFGQPLSTPQPQEQQAKQEQAPVFGFGGFGNAPNELKFNHSPSAEVAGPKTVDAFQFKPSASAEPSKAQSAFSGFSFDKPVFPPTTTVPVVPPTPNSMPSTIPPIFGPRPAQSALPAFSAPHEAYLAKTVNTTPTPFQFPGFTPTVAQSSKPFETLTQAQPSGQPSAQPLMSSSAPPPLFVFNQQAPQPPPTPIQPVPQTPTPQPSFNPPGGGIFFKPAPPPVSLPSIASVLSPKSDSDANDKPKSLAEGFQFFPTQPPKTTSSPGQQDLFQPKSTAESNTQPNPSSVTPQRSTTPPSPDKPPAEPAFTQQDRSKLVASLAKVALVRSEGLLQKYIEYTLPDLVRTAFNQHRLEVHDAAVASVRQRILARKFGAIWRLRAWKKSLNRRAKNRRHLFAETMRAEEAKKKRSEEDLEAILHASHETRRLQEEVRAAVEAEKFKISKQDNIVIGKVAGKKRKSISAPHQKRNATSTIGTPQSSKHKRSRTMDTSSDPPFITNGKHPAPNFRATTSRPQHISTFSGHSIHGRSTSNQDLRRSTVGQQVDTTHTDYFRLKALGMDPETPIIPYTKETLALRKRREEEERQTSIARAKRRPGSFRPQQSPSSPASLPSQSVSAETTPRKLSTQPGAGEDDFLKEIRAAREAIREQEEWFKQQTVTLGKELRQEEESRKDQGRHVDSVTPSTKGLAKVNGYEYLPAEVRSGSILSRTERRIQQTGAHGLATKPLRPTFEYVPVAMSKRSALGYSGGATPLSSEQRYESSPARKRLYDDGDLSFNTDQPAERLDSVHASKRPRSISNRPSQGVSRQNSKTTLLARTYRSDELVQSISYHEDETGDDTDGEEEDEADGVGQYHSANATPGDDSGDGEEDLEEEEESAEEDEYDGPEEEYSEDDGTEEHDYATGYAQANDEPDNASSPMTNPQLSRAASSAPGGSVADAFVLSDSDG